jgi:subtilase family serine protease
MAAGQSVSRTYDMAGLPPGKNTFNFILNPYSTVIESNEKNNAKFGYFAVTAE